MKKFSLEELLEGIEDTRRSNSVIYPLHEILFIMLIAIICGAKSYAQIEMFASQKIEWFKKYLKLENGIPDANTFRYVLMKINPEKLHSIFAEWMKSVIPQVKGVIAIDGKQARRTGDAKKRPLHVVSAFAEEYGLVLGQISCEEKSNEITAIPKLLEILEISGCIVTIDAMGTQTEIAKKIREKNADYILSLKNNQPNLYNDVKLFMDEYCKDLEAKNKDSYSYTLDDAHGRLEKRECFVCNNIGWLDNREKWADIHGIGMIIARIEENGVISEQRHYFIYSCQNLNAAELMKAKRSHWSVENSLHWVLDVAFREDESRARKDFSAENFNALRQFAYNILKSDKSFKGSFPNKQFKCLLDSDYLDKVVSDWLCS
jgi:predicted transposase YbfD/YdcC